MVNNINIKWNNIHFFDILYVRDEYMGELKHGRTCVFNINYHIVWSTKYRRKVLTPTIEKRLKEILINVGKQKSFEIAEIEVKEKDHVHVFVSAIPKISISYIAKMMKGISGRLLLKEFPEISKELWNGELWNPSYYVETIGCVSEEAIRIYIQNQEKE